MAYRRFTSAADLLEEEFLVRESPNSANFAASFTREEWTVIDLAERDGVWSLHTQGRLQRAIRWLFGIEIARPLANERLEGLRRLAVRAWRWGKLNGRAVEEFVAAGFSRRHAELVLEKVARRQRIKNWPEGLA